MSPSLKLGTLAALILISLSLSRAQSSTNAVAYSYASSTSSDDDEAIPTKKVIVKPKPKPEPEPEPEPEIKAEAVVVKEPEPECTFEPDFTTTEKSLRSFIFQGDVEKAAEILNSNRTNSLAAGSTYNADEQCLVVRSEERERDPDVVAFRAVCLNALKTGEIKKLARVIVDSYTSDCQTCLFSSDELDDYVDGFVEFLSNKDDLIEVLEEDPAEDGARRKLLVTEASPTNSFYCAYCYPNKGCRRVRWCRDDK